MYDYLFMTIYIMNSTSLNPARMNTPFWLNNPSILFNKNEIKELWPADTMTFTAKLNAITRTVIGLTVLGYVITQNVKVVFSGILTLGAIILLFLSKKNTINNIEGFRTNAELYELIKPDITEPTERNPAMNVLLPELNENPNRKKAAPAFNPIVDKEMNDKTKTFIVNNFNNTENISERLFKVLGDSFNFDQSMRAWHPTPNTTIPNDQKAFVEYCYGDMISCRDETNNELACTRNTPPRWTNY